MLQEFTDEIRAEIDSRVKLVHTAIHAGIVSFDAAKSRATVKPYGVFMAGSKAIPYPMIDGVPVIQPVSAAAECGLTVPVKPGDDCLLIVSEQDISSWLDGMEQDYSLTHDLTSAIALCGLSRKPNSHMSFAGNNNAVRIYSGETVIDVKKDCVKITQGGTELTVSGGAVKVTGNLTVSGNITYSGTCSKG